MTTLTPSDLADVLQEHFGSYCLDNRAEAYKLAEFILQLLERAYEEGVEKGHDDGRDWP